MAKSRVKNLLITNAARSLNPNLPVGTSTSTSFPQFTNDRRSRVLRFSRRHPGPHRPSQPRGSQSASRPAERSFPSPLPSALQCIFPYTAFTHQILSALSRPCRNHSFSAVDMHAILRKCSKRVCHSAPFLSHRTQERRVSSPLRKSASRHRHTVAAASRGTSTVVGPGAVCPRVHLQVAGGDADPALSELGWGGRRARGIASRGCGGPLALDSCVNLRRPCLVSNMYICSGEILIASYLQ